MAATPAPAPERDTPPPPSDWVPADRRWAGFDRRTLWPAFFVAGFALLLNLGAPALNAAVGYHDPVRTGDVMALPKGAGFVPVAGWNVESGVRLATGLTPPAETRLAHGDVAFSVTVGAFSGDARALVDQIKKTTDAIHGSADLHVTGEPAEIATAAGDRGMAVRYHSTSAEGVLAAFVRDGSGVEIVVSGPVGLSTADVRDVATMIDSLRFAGEEAG